VLKGVDRIIFASDLIAYAFGRVSLSKFPKFMGGEYLNESL